MMSIKLNKFKKIIGFIILLGVSFYIATHISLYLSIRSAKTNIPDYFNVIIYYPPDSIGLKQLNYILENPVIKNGGSYLIPEEKVLLLNKELAHQYTGNGGTWEFEIITSEKNKQYIHITASGDDDIIESWYWVTNDNIVPDKFRWLNPGISFLVLPLSITLVSIGIGVSWLINKQIYRAISITFPTQDKHL
jgi:hypothetical protein